jgi:glycosyltransferase involved in cell wall biosynthesis
MKRQLAACLGGFHRTRLETVWNQVNTDWFQPSPDTRALKVRLGLDPDGHDISITAALAPHKGHVCFLRAAQLILRQFPCTNFHIIGSAKAGSSEHAKELHRLADELGIAQRVRFWGFVKDEVARDLLAASDLFILPTTEEGFGLSIAEAQACQVPVLTSLIPPLDEVVDNGRTGHLIPPGDHEQFARLASDLLGNPEHRKAMGAAARSWVLARFSNQAHIQHITSLYDEVQSGKASNFGSTCPSALTNVDTHAATPTDSSPQAPSHCLTENLKQQ